MLMEPLNKLLIVNVRRPYRYSPRPFKKLWIVDRSMLMEPLLLVSAFFLLFLLSILYVRMDFSITVDEGAEAKMKVAGYCEKVANLQVCLLYYFDVYKMFKV